MEKKIDYAKEFEKEFENLCYRKGLNRRETWSNLMYMFACSISNRFEPRKEIREKREKTFSEYELRLEGIEIPSKLLSCLTLALLENPNQDFLGKMYMQLSMGEKAWGQVFTPYSVCELMANITFNNPEEAIKENGFATVLDPAVGGGAMLISASQILRNKGFDPESNLLAVGQDIDLTAINMAYTQLSLIGCPAVLICDDSILNPYDENPLFIGSSSNYWYTPALFQEIWNKRRKEYIEKIRKKEIKKEKVEKSA